MPPQIRLIAASETRALRQSVLRPGRPLETAIFEGDDENATIHLGAVEDSLSAVSEIIGVATFLSRPFTAHAAELAYQLRGMATAPEWRGRGIGAAMLTRGTDICRERGARILWCNARTSAAEFYAKSGFIQLGALFVVPESGPHFVMWRWL